MKEKKRKIVMLVDSRSDIPKVRDGISLLRIAQRRGLIEWRCADVCSVHRNGKTLREIVEEYSDDGVDAIIAVAGKLAALFGDIDSMLRNEHENSTTRVIPVPLKGKSEQSSLAALYSVLEVPNHKLLYQEDFFQNPTAAFEFAIYGPLAPIELEEQKPAERLTPENFYEIARIKHPGRASYEDTIQWLEANGLDHLYTGKTRETFSNFEYPDLLYILATDRISIYDIVLNARIKHKGAVLTAMTIFWLTKVFADIPNHLVAYGRDIESYLPKSFKSMGDDEHRYLMTHMIVVTKTAVLKVEAIVRGFLTGSGFKDYSQTGKISGMPLIMGLKNGSQLDQAYFTPSTKADYGLHDENISWEKAAEIIGEQEMYFVMRTSQRLYLTAGELARQVGIIIADTKFEFGRDKNGNIIVIDEVLTPDSSRFWPIELWEIALANGYVPPSLDKQGIRDAGAAAGVKKNPNWIPPQELINETSEKYLKVFRLLNKKSLEKFQQEDMGI